MRWSWSSGITSFACLCCGMMYCEEIRNEFQCGITCLWLFFTEQRFPSKSYRDETDVITNHHDRPINNCCSAVYKQEENSSR